MPSKLPVAPSESPTNVVQCCWICFATSTDDLLAEWVQPCKCRGTVQWVHQKCLQRWVDEKQKGNSRLPVKCPHCLTEYIITFPRMGLLVSILHEVREGIKVFCPFLVAGVAIVILYWTSVTYGAITLLQVMGYDDGMRLLERTQPLALIVALPSIPVALILGQLFKWEDILSNTLLQFIAPNRTQTNNFVENRSTISQLNETSTPISGSRILCSALLLPTVSTIVGRAFQNIESNLLKTILGGLTFIAVKGTINIVLQYSDYIRKRHKKILDFNEGNLSEFVNNRRDRLRSDSGDSVDSSNASMEMLVIENLMPM